MAEASKLELLLLAKDKMSPALQRLLKLFKQAEKDGKSGASAIDKLTKKLETAPKTDGLKKANSELAKTATAAGAAAAAEEKLNNVRKRGVRGSTGTRQEAAAKNNLAAATQKAAAAEEKLNAARKRGSDGRLRNSRGKFVLDPNRTPSNRPASGSSNGNFQDDLVQGGAGAGMLWTAKQGLGSAMSKQEAMTDLYNSFYRSSLGAAELNAQMRQGEKIADELGNKLPGTTAEYLQMFATMKERGIETDSILKGAGKSAAYLAVANKEDRQEVGSNVARFGQMFNLKTESEYMGASELMSRAKTTYGIGSSELMEAVKDFSGRTGKGLGLDGQKGAEDTLRYLAFLRAKTGMEGLTVGTSASSFFGQYLKAKEKKKDPTEELKKLTGVDLQVFDEKGKFLGLENAVKEFAKLKGKLSDEQAVSFGGQIAGEEGSAVFQAMVKNGDQFGAFNKEMTEAASLQEKSAKNAENLTNKIEALTGSLSNLGAAGFQPIIAPLGSATDKTNEWVGKLTEAAKAQPVFAATAASVLTLGGALLTLKGGSGVLSGIANRIGGVSEAAVVGTSRAGALSKSLTSLPTMLKIGLTVMIAAEAWEQIQKLRSTIDDWKKMNSGLNDVGAGQYKAQQQEDAVLREQGKAPDYKERAANVLSLLQQGNQEFAKALDPKKLGWQEWLGRGVGTLAGKDTNFSLYQGKPTTTDLLKNDQQHARVREVQKMPFAVGNVEGIFKNAFDRVASEIAGVKNLQSRAPMLADPNTMTAFRRDALPSLNLSDVKRQFVEQMLQQAFPASFAQSSQQLALGQSQLADQTGQLAQSFSNLQQPSNELGNGFSNLNNNSNNTANAVGNLANATASAAARISSVQITPPTFAPIRVPVFGQAPAPDFGQNPNFQRMFGRARGGSVKKGQPVTVGEIGREMFVPQASGSIVSNDILRRNSSANSNIQNIHLTASINIDGSSGNARQLAEEIRREFAAAVSEIKADLDPDKVARRVASSAERHAERT